ncbi:MAG: hypothetical protein RMK19_08465 [Bacteroidia bacterium]|nr:hypothetical protein [Bacteroidia bacterium]MDW8016028.1 hypothetical protein [Bacteroidia bacterium]
MSSNLILERISLYEQRRSARWAFTILLLWLGLWGLQLGRFFEPQEETLSEIELLVEEAHFHPIDL